MILESLPKQWHMSVEQPLPMFAGREKRGRKVHLFRWTVYMSNGETIGTRTFKSVTVDGDDLDLTIRQAVGRLTEKIEESSLNGQFSNNQEK